MNITRFFALTIIVFCSANYCDLTVGTSFAQDKTNTQPTQSTESDTSSNSSQAGIVFGTTGAGLQYIKRFDNYSGLGIRLISGYFSLSNEMGVSDVSYSTNLELLNFIAALDYKTPIGISFMAGLSLNNNSVTISATPSSNVQIGDASFSPLEVGSISGVIETNTISPYVGLGLEIFSLANLSVGLNAGVFFQGPPQVTSLTTTGFLSDITTAISQEDIDNEKANINNELKKYNMYPVVTFNILYEF